MSLKQRLIKWLSLAAQPVRVVRLFKWLLVILLGAIIVMVLMLSIKSADGNVNASVLLGQFYDQTNLMKIQAQRNLAKSYFEKASLFGSVEGQCYLGELYAEELNYKLAGIIYLDAALKGSQQCEVNFLKLSYPNEKLVFDILKIKADKNNPVAQFMVGKKLIEGTGVNTDLKSGINYLEKSVAQGHWGAKVYLAGIYIQGKLVPQDIKRANKLMEVK